MYFLVITILQFIEIISPWDPWPGTIPLVVVVGLGMIRELIEDFYRYKSDRETNSQEACVL
jgi:hypothetical protein